MQHMQALFLTSIYITVGLWEYCMFFRNKGELPKVQGYAVFSLMLWISILIGGINIFGLLNGTLLLIFCLFFLQYITHFTVGILLNFLIREKSDIALSLFAIMVWVNIAIVIISFL